MRGSCQIRTLHPKSYLLCFGEDFREKALLAEDLSSDLDMEKAKIDYAEMLNEWNRIREQVPRLVNDIMF